MRTIDLGTAFRDDARPATVGLYLASAAVAAAVLAPLGWLVLGALSVRPSTAVELLTRSTTVRVFLNSAALVVATTTACVLVGVPLAWLTVRTDLPFRRAWTVLVALPLVIPSYVGAFAFVSAFGPRGRLQDLLAPVGVESLPSIYGLWGTVLVLTLYTYPYVFVTARAALKTLDTRLIDAARTLRHDRTGAFRRVVVPHLRPAVAAGGLLSALYVLSDLGTPEFMRFQVFATVIYSASTYSLDLASLLSLQLLGVTVLVLAVESRTRGEERLSGTRGGSHRGDVVRLGRWRWVAVLFPAVVAALALVVPVGVLLWWLVDGGGGLTGVAFDPAYALNSVSVAIAAASLATAAGLPIAYLAARRDSNLATLFERISYVGYAVPGVVLGLALIFLTTRTVPALYQTLPVLVFAYVVRFLPQAVGSTRASFLSVNPRLPEAARTLGRTSIGAFRRVTFPLVAPGLLGGAALVFLTTMKELPATLLLRPTGFETLVTVLWRAQANYAYGAAAVPALLLLAISAASIVVVLRGEGYDVG
ncbi:MAG: ABC transporter permease [Halolamina sp.]